MSGGGDIGLDMTDHRTIAVPSESHRTQFGSEPRSHQ